MPINQWFSLPIGAYHWSFELSPLFLISNFDKHPSDFYLFSLVVLYQLFLCLSFSVSYCFPLSFFFLFFLFYCTLIHTLFFPIQFRPFSCCPNNFLVIILIHYHCFFPSIMLIFRVAFTISAWLKPSTNPTVNNMNTVIKDWRSNKYVCLSLDCKSFSRRDFFLISILFTFSFSFLSILCPRHLIPSHPDARHEFTDYRSLQKFFLLRQNRSITSV